VVTRPSGDAVAVMFRPMHQWARNKLNENPGGIVELPPSSVRELATFVGCTYPELANHLAQFLPEEVIAEAD
jgi:hypothetical protein